MEFEKKNFLNIGIVILFSIFFVGFVLLAGRNELMSLGFAVVFSVVFTVLFTAIIVWAVYRRMKEHAFKTVPEQRRKVEKLRDAGMREYYSKKK